MEGRKGKKKHDDILPHLGSAFLRFYKSIEKRIFPIFLESITNIWELYHAVWRNIPYIC